MPSILNAPSMTQNDKSQIVQELQRHMGNLEKGDTVKQFLKTLAENNRLGILEGVCEKFAVLMGAAKGELEMVVQSASVRHSYHGGNGTGDVERGLWCLSRTFC